MFLAKIILLLGVKLVLGICVSYMYMGQWHEWGGVFYNGFYGYTLLLVGSVESYVAVGGFGRVLPRCGELGGVSPRCKGAG